MIQSRGADGQAGAAAGAPAGPAPEPGAPRRAAARRRPGGRRPAPDGQRHPFGTSLRVHVESSVPVDLFVEVSTQAPAGSPPDIQPTAKCRLLSIDGAAVCYASYSSAALGLPKATARDAFLLGLAPATTYHWVVKTTDAAGTSAYAQGTATTLKRKVTVTFRDILVLDDSDSLSEGDPDFHFRIDDTHYPELRVSDSSTGSNEWVEPSPNRTKVLDNYKPGAPANVYLYVEGQDDDCGFFDGLCTSGTAPDWGHGSNGDLAWATASTKHVIRYRESPGSEAYSEDVSFQTTIDLLKFRVYATIAVSYHA